ncbi:MAG: hypothetical protein DRP11_02740 [Candidatus Aenigmatarchaeota archaeon]|nr:MAG: hypothetical protein DRP11_02740 [Candidatus Aenigmarchaeota archaeon]
MIIEAKQSASGISGYWLQLNPTGGGLHEVVIVNGRYFTLMLDRSLGQPLDKNSYSHRKVTSLFMVNLFNNRFMLYILAVISIVIFVVSWYVMSAGILFPGLPLTLNPASAAWVRQAYVALISVCLSIFVAVVVFINYKRSKMILSSSEKILIYVFWGFWLFLVIVWVLLR